MGKKEENTTSKYSLVVTVSFFILLAGLGIAAIVMPDVEVSVEERRYYASSPQLTWEALTDGSYMSDLEDYLLDQFVGRDWFRKLKTEVETKLLGKTDANGYVRLEDGLYELDLNWNPDNVTRAARKFATLQEQWFTEADVYYALIPDKSYFLPEDTFPAAEDAWVLSQMQEQLTNAVYVDVYPYLEIEDYYRTDLHWKQEAIGDVAEVLLISMQGEKEQVQGKNDEIEIITEAFYGGYAGASAYKIEPDSLQAVTNEVIKGATVYDYERQQCVSVYAPEKINGTDPYDYYLWGARALLTIENPICENGEKLLLFRDSFGSSIAPLLIEGYKEITLVDLRYISADYLAEMIDLTAYDDVLFLYSQKVLWHSNSMKF